MAKACSPQVLSLQVLWLTVPLPHLSNLAYFGGGEPSRKEKFFRESFLENKGISSEVYLRGLHLAEKEIALFCFSGQVLNPAELVDALQGRCSSPQCLGGPLNGLGNWLMGIPLLQPNGILNRDV